MQRMDAALPSRLSAASLDAGADFGVGHVQAELITQHRPELGFVAQVPPFCLARRVPKLNMVIRVLLGPGRAAMMLF